MSYNVLFGAGADPIWERRAAQLSPYAYPGNRLPAILEVIKAAQPDIVGIEEAAAWDNGSPPIVQQVAEALGLNYYLAPVGNGLHLALFTRFQIVETENLSERMGNVGALRATLSLPDRQLLTVFVVHLDPFSATTRTRELAILTQEMASYLSTPTLLLGDMNFYCLDTPEQCQEYQVLTGAGWHLALTGQYKIDQIWTSPGLAQPVEALTFPGASFDISDHLPVGTVFKIPPSQ
jgi:endonuclease/exonuclease/phosphatase family metal-dependent hydrolase